MQHTAVIGPATPAAFALISTPRLARETKAPSRPPFCSSKHGFRTPVSGANASSAAWVPVGMLHRGSGPRGRRCGSPETLRPRARPACCACTLPPVTPANSSSGLPGPQGKDAQGMGRPRFASPASAASALHTRPGALGRFGAVVRHQRRPPGAPAPSALVLPASRRAVPPPRRSCHHGSNTTTPQNTTDNIHTKQHQSN